MKVKVQAEPLGSIQETTKGFIRQFLVLDNMNQKSVIKLFSKNASDLEKSGERVVETDDFCFVPKA